MGNDTAAEAVTGEGRRLDIQGLRAVAVLLVIAAHAGISHFEAGFIGVDIFFVISGYVITGLLQRQPARAVRANLRHFYIRRILRIVPAATVTLVATVIAAYALLGSAFNPSLLEDVRAAALFSANFRLISTSSDYFMVGVDPSLVTHFWSLAIEEQFYFVYPLVVFALTWLAPVERRTQVLRGFLLLVVIVSAVHSAVSTPLDPVVAYYSPLTRFWELALGGLMVTLPENWRSPYPRVSLTISWLAAAAVGWSLMVITPTGFPGTAAWLPCAATAVLLRVGHSIPGQGIPKILSATPLRYIGDISYSLYLWHFVWLMLPKQISGIELTTNTLLLAIAGTFACAAASYHWLENPIRHSKKLQNDGLATALLLLVALAISVDTTIVVESLWLNR